MPAPRLQSLVGGIAARCRTVRCRTARGELSAGLLQAGLVALCAISFGAAASAQDLRDLARRLDQATGRVLTGGADGQLLGTGSGYALDIRDAGQNLYFLTNQHVVEAATEILVGYGEEDGVRLFDAVVIAKSRSFDMALLRLTADGHGFAPRRLSLAAHEIAQGDLVYAIGFPAAADALIASVTDPAFFEPTLTQGIIGKRLSASWSNGHKIDIIQHDATINPGNSGGPLVSPCGVVVGLNTAGVTDGVQGTFLSASAVAIAAFLASIEMTPVTVGTECGAAIDASDEPMDRRIALALGGGGMVLVVLGGVVLLRMARHTSAPLAPSGRILARIGGAKYVLLTDRLIGGLVIGRGEAADLWVDDPSLSREHAHLQLRDRKLFLQDLGSTNGSHVGGRRLQTDTPVQINTTSDIRLGGVAMRLRRMGEG